MILNYSIPKTRIHTLNSETLQNNVIRYYGVNNSHAIVVTAIDEDDVSVCDPLQGERLLPRSTFDTAWAMMRNLAILVRD